MVQTVVSREPAAEVSPASAEYIKAFRWMLLARLLDEKLASLYRGGKIHGGCFIGKGQEALSAAIGTTLRKGDVFSPLIRDTAGRLAFGEPILDALRTYLGSPLGPMRGRDGNVHRGRPREGLLVMISHLGAMISVVNGVLIGKRFKGMTGIVGAASIGEGATSTGAFHEALNQAAIERLPLVVVVANNHYAYSTPNRFQFACDNLVDRAKGYGVRGHEVDGTDLGACLEVIGEAVRLARSGDGPQLVIAELLRLCGHGEHDDASYIEPELKQSKVGRDCIKVADEHLARLGWAEASTIEAWRAEAAQEIDDAVAVVQREGSPDPFRERWCPLASTHLRDIGHEL